MKIPYHYFQDFINLFFPELCVACQGSLLNHEYSLCTHCLFDLPRTNFHTDPQNPLFRKLWGHFPFKSAAAFIYFHKGSKVQNIIHQLKYNNKAECGFRMGELYGYDLKLAEQWQGIDLIIPVPLHPKKERLRGYNQSEHIAYGLGSTMNIPISTTCLKRKVNTESQTQKSRFNRYKNLRDAFKIQNSDELTNKHVLLVDDVTTTGATLEACALALLENKNVQISIVCMAYAQV